MSRRLRADLLSTVGLVLLALLPNADLGAITPVTGERQAPYWLAPHKRSVTTAVTAVGGKVVDLGQPGPGDGRDLSPAHAGQDRAERR